MHTTIVIKPTHGCNVRGVLRLSIADDSMEGVPTPDGEPRQSPSLAHALPSGMMWASAPVKQQSVLETSRCLPRDGWFDELVLQNHDLAGSHSRFLCEPAIAHDQELCVLAVCGGRVQVLVTDSL